jgi:hypothetical protein
MIEKVGFENILICLIIFINFRRFKKENICDIKKNKINICTYVFIYKKCTRKETNKQTKKDIYALDQIIH